MSHTLRDKKRLLTRIRRIKGQAEALEKVIAEEAECSAVLQQIAAIRGAVNGLMTEVLEGHIREHLGADKVPPRQRQADVEQVVRTLRSYLK
ncbi:metal/formaldehyde-sensitive transcriptional repressor [Paralcaligenes sp. KSB-10]|jgi:DNA-binding FrmR family transcriptional regulator|uniref:metal/formaldehyde-sensitive transcriptional repressor n=1 Tax=Paralcaligenes sp. KSB-10 TaxID=2901142 RepID=UPI001E417F02|nr:metal/formaldehyde-sensitive transcriptional repressor [Paralcaligenes sp. KSB-10]UHL64793.1 metal/formaldehyde-sensitive transcriptional repressor [Paralcaligenes sp. KSB-10]